MRTTRLIVLASALLATTANAIVLPAGFSDEVVLSGLNAPTGVDFASDGRVFVAEKSGIIKLFPTIDSAPLVFADLRTQVHSAEDRGLTSLKLHPNFPTVPYLYIAYTLDAAIGGTPPVWGRPNDNSDQCPEDGCLAAGRLSRIEVAGNTAGNEMVLIENWCQQFGSHSLGGITFDRDGALYIGAGEGGSALDVDYGQLGRPRNACGDPPANVNQNPSPQTSRGGALRAQNLAAATNGQATYAGKILRVDPLTGAALADNPLAGNAVAGADRIIARGLRQPFRLTTRPGTNEVWLGDVGWGSWEEINRVLDPRTSLPNFGWPCFQGPDIDYSYAALGNAACESLYASPAGHSTPFFTYSHEGEVAAGDGERCPGGNSAITGLAFYQGSVFPSSYQGALFFADYARACIWVMQPGADGVPDPDTRAAFASEVPAPVDLHLGPGGALYYIDVVGGAVHRINYASGNRAPIVVLHTDVTSGRVPLMVHFDASESTDPEGGPLAFRWDFNGDGSIDATGPTAQFTYTQAGRVTARVTVLDRLGGESHSEVTIAVGNRAPTARIVVPSSDFHWQVGDRIDFRGEGLDPDDGSLPPAAYAWSLLLHHCPKSGCHVHFIQQLDGAVSGTFTALDHEYPSHLELQLKVTDGDGLTASDSVLLYPSTSEFMVDSVPPGLRIAVGPHTANAPFSQTLIAGSNQTVTAPSPQRLGCREYRFVSWSDGGARSHSIQAATAGGQLSATFAPVSDEPCVEACAGDCDGDSDVPVDELVTVVNIALSDADVAQCLNADLNNDGQVTVEEILAAVRSALDGCAVSAGSRAAALATRVESRS